MGLGRIASGLLIGSCLTMAAPAAAAAQAAPIMVRAGPLSSALHDLARRSNVEIVFDEAMVRGLSAPAVRGRMPVEAALRRLLSGTGLRARRLAAGAFLIERRPSAAIAARPIQPPPPPDEAPVPEILIIGKRTQNVDIRRRENDVQPYQVSTGEQIVRAHRDTVDQYFTSRVTANTQSFPPSLLDNGETVSQIDLRGLGPDSTLILLDGRRLPNTPSANVALGFQQPDLNAIPLHAIDRVETLTGTAGGIYGFGALGGVVNVILKRDYRGVELHATGGISSRGDARRLGLEGRLGFTPNEGSTDVMLYLSHARTEPLFVGQRDFARRDFEQTSRIAPERLVSDSPRRNSVGVFSFGGELTFKPEYGGQPLGSEYTFLPVGFAGTPTDLAAALSARAGELDLEPSEGEERSELGSSAHVTSAMLNVRHRFSPGIEIFADAVVLRNRGRHLRHLDAGFLFLFPDSPANPFNEFVQITFPVAGRDVERRVTVTTQRYTAGLVASLPFRWRGTAEASLGSATYHSQGSDEGYYNGPLFQFGGEEGPALNPFGPWDEFQEATAFPGYRFNAFSDFRGRNRYRELSLRFAGPLLDAAGGPVTLTLLAQRRREKVPDLTRLQKSDLSEFETRYAKRSNRTASYYAELRAPLGAPDAQIPLLRSLELQLAVRHDAFKPVFSSSPTAPEDGDLLRPSFSATAYTAGGKLTPFPWLMLRGSYATGAQPPRLEDLVSIELPNFGFFPDPKRGNNLIFLDGSFVEKNGGSPDLGLLRANTLSLGAVLTPRGPAGPRLSLDYSRIRRVGDTLRLNAILVVANEDQWPERVTREPLTAEDQARGFEAGRITMVDARAMNGVDRTVESLDGRLDWPVPLLGGTLRVYAMATMQMTHREEQPFKSALQRVGYLGTPLKWRANGGLEWSKDGTAVGANLQYFSRYRIFAPEVESVKDLPVSYQGSEWVRAQTYLDIFASRRFALGGPTNRSRLKVDLGIVNLFDRRPPRESAFGVFGGQPGYSLYGDPRWRRFELVLSSEF